MEKRKRETNPDETRKRALSRSENRRTRLQYSIRETQGLKDKKNGTPNKMLDSEVKLHVWGAQKTR